MKVKYFCWVLFSAVANSSQATGWHEVGEVTRLHTGHGSGSFNNGAIYFTTKTQVNVEGCSNKGYTFDENNENSDRIYSLILSAYLSKQPISIYVTGSCFGSRPKVDAVQYKNSGVPF